MTTEVVTVEPATPFKEIVVRLAAHRTEVTPRVTPPALLGREYLGGLYRLS